MLAMTRRCNVPEDRHISIEEDGRVLSTATVSAPDDNNEAHAQVHMAPGHLPAGTRQQMADAICDAVTEDDAERLSAAVPRGDCELVEGISGHLADSELRAAGATSIIQGRIKPDS
jgi:hypothetical protein